MAAIVVQRHWSGQVAGRPTKTFTTDGLNDVTWVHAGSVSDDIVLEQTQTEYDNNGNPIFVISKQRFHTEMATGELSGPNTPPKARVYYAASYYDAADRLTDSVNLGTNGGQV